MEPLLGLVHHSPSVPAEFFDNAMVRHGLADERVGVRHSGAMLGCDRRQVNELADELADVAEVFSKRVGSRLVNAYRQIRVSTPASQGNNYAQLVQITYVQRARSAE